MVAQHNEYQQVTTTETKNTVYAKINININYVLKTQKGLLQHIARQY